MSFISLAQAHADWSENIRPHIPADDGPALAESWSNYTDGLATDNQLCALQYHYAPDHDEKMPGFGVKFDPLSDDRDFILDAMGITLGADVLHCLLAEGDAIKINAAIGAAKVCELRELFEDF